jgi:hypothetical protein
MNEAWRVVPSFAACGVGAVLAQRFALPGATLGGVLRGVARPRVPAGEALTLCVGFAAACLLLLLTARPVMSVLCCLGLYALLVTLNRAKEQALREPLVLADAFLVRQAIAHSHMYVPFLPVKKIAVLLGALLLCLVFFTVVECPLSALRSVGAQAALALGAATPVLCIALLRRGRLRRLAAFLLRACPVSHDAARDAVNNGPLTAALLHPVLAGSLSGGHGGYDGPDFLRDIRIRPKESRWPENFERLLADIDAVALERDTERQKLRPHIVVVQAESFCDIRERLHGERREALKDFLPNWDSLMLQGRALPTPENAFGAYTMRTEFAVLTGLQAKDLGPWAFNPYLLAARQPLWSLAWHLRERDYTALCLHPYSKRFFRRDKVMPNLGFDRFWGLRELRHLEKYGPYASDLELAKFALQKLRAPGKAFFCFVITMEAHGPWQEGRLSDAQVKETLSDIDAGLFSPQMRLYLCHLRHMDQMFGMLLRAKAGECGGREVEVWAYGDHAPGIRQK